MPCHLAAQYHAMCVDTCHAFNGLTAAAMRARCSHRTTHIPANALHPWDTDASGRTA